MSCHLFSCDSQKGYVVKRGLTFDSSFFNSFIELLSKKQIYHTIVKCNVPPYDTVTTNLARRCG
jgi:hypothetical protein